MATSTVEQYIKIIFQEQQKSGSEVVQMKQLSEAMNVTPGTATTMVKHLSERGFIRYQPRKGVELLPPGRDLAVRIIRRHRLIETFLERVLDYDWAEVHDEAEQLEHSVSDLFVSRLDEYLGFPPTDPHGDPIPSSAGVFSRRPSHILPESAEGTTVTVVRLTEDTKSFLDLMKANHIVPGEAVKVEAVDRAAGVVTVVHLPSDHRFTMSFDIASKVRVSAST